MERYFKRIVPFSIEEQNVNRKKSNVARDQSETNVVQQECDICVESNVTRDQSEIQVEIDVWDEDI